MWKYIGYAGIILPVLGATYGGLRIASDLQSQLEDAGQAAHEAHERIGHLEANWEGEASKMEMDIENALEKLGFTIDNNKTNITYKVEDFQRELLEVQKVLTMLEGITQSLEKKSFETASMIQIDGLREQIFQIKDSVMQLQNPVDGGINYQQMIFDVQNQIQELERRVNEEHKGNWN